MGMKPARPKQKYSSGPCDLKRLEREMGNPALPATAPTPGSSIADRVGRLEVEISALRDRVHALEAQGPAPKDDMSTKLLDFLTAHAGLKFNTGAIAGNLDTNSMKISDKLKTLAHKGLIQTSKNEGQSAMYWVPDKSTSIATQVEAVLNYPPGVRSKFSMEE